MRLLGTTKEHFKCPECRHTANTCDKQTEGLLLSPGLAANVEEVEELLGLELVELRRYLLGLSRDERQAAQVRVRETFEDAMRAMVDFEVSSVLDKLRTAVTLIEQGMEPRAVRLSGVAAAPSTPSVPGQDPYLVSSPTPPSAPASSSRDAVLPAEPCPTMRAGLNGGGGRPPFVPTADDVRSGWARGHHFDRQ